MRQMTGIDGKGFFRADSIRSGALARLPQLLNLLLSSP